MKILSFFSRATIILFLQICFVTSLTVSFCEPVFAAKSSKKKKSKKKKSKKKKKSAKKKKAEKKKAAKKKAEKKETPKPAPIAALTKFQTETTYWCGSIYCDKAKDDDDAACLLSPGDKPMQCVYGNIKVNPRDKSLKKLKLGPEDDNGMEMCLYELRALCGGYSASFGNDKDIVSAECEKGKKMYRCVPAFENIPPSVASKTTSSFPAATGSSSSPAAIAGTALVPPLVAGSSSVTGGDAVAAGAALSRPVISEVTSVVSIPGASSEPLVNTAK